MQPTFHEDIHEGIGFAGYLGRFYEINRGKRVPEAPTSSDGIRTVALAYINQGRWVAQCAACPNAVLVSKGYPYMICSNVSCGLDAWQAVVMPLKDFEVLGELVMRRPNVENQNWELGDLYEGDPVDYIKLENRLHGIE